MRSKQTGFSLIELLVVVSVILIVAAIAIPNLLRSRMAANEASAVASLRSINTSQIVYQSSYGPGFAGTLGALSDGGAPANCAPPTPPAATSACLIDSALASGTKSGYTFTYAPTAGGGPITTYTVNADPISAGSAGPRHFFSEPNARDPIQRYGRRRKHRSPNISGIQTHTWPPQTAHHLYNPSPV